MLPPDALNKLRGKGVRVTLGQLSDLAQGAGFRPEAAGYEAFVNSVLALLAVPGTIVLLAAILYMSAFADRRFLSPRSLILGVVRARGNSPEFAEAFVARQLERILREESAA